MLIRILKTVEVIVVFSSLVAVTVGPMQRDPKLMSSPIGWIVMTGIIGTVGTLVYMIITRIAVPEWWKWIKTGEISL